MRFVTQSGGKKSDATETWKNAEKFSDFTNLPEFGDEILNNCPNKGFKSTGFKIILQDPDLQRLNLGRNILKDHSWPVPKELVPLTLLIYNLGQEKT